MKKHLILGLICSFAILSSIHAEKIALHWVNEKPVRPRAVSWGVPFKKGQIKNDQVFNFKNTTDQIMPVQSWPMAWWPDGSVKWMGFSAITDSSNSYYLEKARGKSVVKPDRKTSHLNNIPGTTTASTKSSLHMKVSENNSEIIVENGIFTCHFAKSGDQLIPLIEKNGRIAGSKGQLKLTLENRKNNRTSLLDNYIGHIEKCDIENDGNVRTLIKIEGHYQADSETESQLGHCLPFVIRFYIYFGVPEIKLVYSFVYDIKEPDVYIKGMGFKIGVPLREETYNRHVRFSGENGGLWSESVKPLTTRYPFRLRNEFNLSARQVEGKKIPDVKASDSSAYLAIQELAEWNDYKLTQIHPRAFTISKRTNEQSSWLFANNGGKSDGYAFVGDHQGGIALSLKDFWESYPASLEVNNARTQNASINAWFWSPDADAMDLRHYDTIPHGLLTTYEDVQEGLNTPFGISRTSEMTLIIHDSLPTKSECVAEAFEASSSNILACVPEYYHETEAFGLWSLPDKSSSNPVIRWMENQIDSSLIFYNQQIEDNQWYGFWNYGDFMHTYDENRHGWRYDIGGYAWDNTELAPNLWLWYSYLRSGNPMAFKLAEKMTRHTSEVDVYHAGEMKGLGSRHNVSHWGCGAKEARIGQALWKRPYYYLTTDERTGELMNESLEAEESACKLDPLRIAMPRDKYPYNAPARLRWGPDWLALAGNWFTAWERTRDTKYLAKIRIGLESLSALPNNLFSSESLGLGYDPLSGKLSLGQTGDNSTNNNHLATIMGGFELLMEMFQSIDCPEFRKTFIEYGKYYSMPANDPERESDKKNWGDINFRNPRLTAYAAAQLNDSKMAERAWREFINYRGRTKLPSLFSSTIIAGPDYIRPIHENNRVGTNGTSQWNLNAILMLEILKEQQPDLNSEAIFPNRDKDLNNYNTFSRRNQSARVQSVQNKSDDKMKGNPSNKEHAVQAQIHPVDATEMNKLIFKDDFWGSWEENWFLDGKKSKIESGNGKLIFRAGPVPGSDEDHSVLWTQKTFSGNLKISFDYTRLDSATKFVNILYLLASGDGNSPYREDIALWSELRAVPAMKNYFDHMNLLHISFAAFNNDNSDPEADYIRIRRYMPDKKEGLENTAWLPDISKTGFFRPAVKHHIEVILKNNHLDLTVSALESPTTVHDNTSNPNDQEGFNTDDVESEIKNIRSKTFHWRNNPHPSLNSGRIGIRLMGSRTSMFENFKVESPE